MWTILLSALLFACGTPGGGEEQKNYGPTTSTVVGAKAVSEAEDNEVIGKGEATARVDGSILERHQKLGKKPPLTGLNGGLVPMKWADTCILNELVPGNRYF